MNMLEDLKNLQKNIERDIAVKQDAIVRARADLNNIVEQINRIENERPKDLGAIVEHVTLGLNDALKVKFYDESLKDDISELQVRIMHVHTHVKEISRLVASLEVTGQTNIGLVESIKRELQLLKDKKCY